MGWGCADEWVLCLLGFFITHIIPSTPNANHGAIPEGVETHLGRSPGFPAATFSRQNTL